jgi:hypothetical protein
VTDRPRVRTTAHVLVLDPAGHVLPELEALEDRPLRGWSVAEIAASGEDCVPAELADLLPELIGGPPSSGAPRIVS